MRSAYGARGCSSAPSALSAMAAHVRIGCSHVWVVSSLTSRSAPSASPVSTSHVERDAQVLQLVPDAVAPDDVVRAAEVGPGTGREIAEVDGVAAADLVRLAGFVEPFGARTGGSSPAAGSGSLTPDLRGDHERLLDEPPSRSSTSIGVDVAVGGHRLGRLEVEAARRTPRGGASTARSWSREQVVGPVDRGPQGLVALDRGRGCPPVSSRNRSSSRARDLRRRQRPRPRRRELDRERDAVEAPADLDDRVDVVGVDRERRVRTARRPARRTAAPRRSGARSVTLDPRTRQRQAADDHDPLAADARAFAARREHAHDRGTAARLVDQVGHRADDVLAVVEHAAGPAWPEVVEQRGDGSSAAARGGTRRAPRRPRGTASASRTGASSQSHAPSGSAAGPRRATCSASRVLPTPPTPVERHQARLARAPSGDLGDLPLAADEGRELLRAGSSGRRRGTAGRGTPAAAPGAVTWNTRSGCAQVAQPVLAEIDEARRRRAASSRTSPQRRQRHQDLAAVRDGHEPRRPVHRRCRSSRRRAARPRRCGCPSGPAAASARATPRAPARAARRRPRRRVVRGREHRVDAVTGRLDHRAVVGLDGVAEDLVVARERGVHRARVLLPQARRTLEVREQERHRPRRQIDHRHFPPVRSAQATPLGEAFRRRRRGSRRRRGASRRWSRGTSPRAARRTRWRRARGRGCPSRAVRARPRPPRTARSPGCSCAAIVRIGPAATRLTRIPCGPEVAGEVARRRLERRLGDAHPVVDGPGLAWLSKSRPTMSRPAP